MFQIFSEYSSDNDFSTFYNQKVFKMIEIASEQLFYPWKPRKYNF